MPHSELQTLVENDRPISCDAILSPSPGLYTRCGRTAEFVIPIGPRVIKAGPVEVPGGRPYFLCKYHWTDAEHPVLPMADFLQKYYEQRLRELKFE